MIIPERLLTRSFTLGFSKSVPDVKAISALKGFLPEICIKIRRGEEVNKDRKLGGGY